MSSRFNTCRFNTCRFNDVSLAITRDLVTWLVPKSIIVAAAPQDGFAVIKTTSGVNKTTISADSAVYGTTIKGH